MGGEGHNLPVKLVEDRITVQCLSLVSVPYAPGRLT